VHIRNYTGLLVIAGPLGLAVAYATLKYLPAPFAWLSSLIAIGCVALIVVVTSSTWKAIWLNAAVVFLLLGAFEGYFYYDRAPARRDSFETPSGSPLVMSRPHDVLGYAPTPDFQGVWSRTIGDDPVFRIGVSIDTNGYRTMPEAESDALPCVFFFGGSMTFGSGVNDNETAPYVVAEATAGRFRVFNLAYRGYGPHQMLASLAEDTYSGALGCHPRVAVYQLISNHIDRAVGFASWDENGPRYVLDEAGVAVQQGSFGKSPQESQSLLAKVINRSLIYSRLRLFLQDRPDHQGAELVQGILRRAREIVETRDSNGRFHVVYWPSSSPLMAAVIDGLEDDGFDLHPITEILPDLAASRSRYRLHEFDGHPTELAHRLIGEYVIREILVAESVLD
jgi:hypothetical protein